MKPEALLVVAVMTCTNLVHAQYPRQFDSTLKAELRVSVQAQVFDPGAVRITGGPFKHAQEMDAAYLLTIEPDRLLQRFHAHAGLPVKGAIYGGWEGEGLSGYTLGHYLSACAILNSE